MIELKTIPKIFAGDIVEAMNRTYYNLQFLYSSEFQLGNGQTESPCIMKLDFGEPGLRPTI